MFRKGMTPTQGVLASLVLSLAMAGAAPVLAKQKPPAVNDEGMELIEHSRLTTIYADPGADLGIYNRIMLEDASVAFKKNWQRNQNRGSRSISAQVRTSDMDRIKADIATLFREVFTEELVKGGYNLVDQAGPDVLIVRPAIIDLDIAAPDLKSAGRIHNYSESAGEMTLLLELVDSETNDKIVTAKDRKEDTRKGYMEWRTSVSNRSVAKRMMRTWAVALREALDEARDVVKSSG